MRTQEVLEGIARERARLLAAVDAMGPRASTAWVTEEGGWTAKDILSHLIHYAGQIAFALGASVQPPAYVVAVDEHLTAEEWNARAVAFWRDTPLDEVRAEFEVAVDHIVERARLRTDDEMAATDAVPWAPGRPLWQLIGGDTFLYEWPAHTEQIERHGSHDGQRGGCMKKEELVEAVSDVRAEWEATVAELGPQGLERPDPARVLAFRVRASHLHQRLPIDSLAEAARGGLQDSAPRAGSRP